MNKKKNSLIVVLSVLLGMFIISTIVLVFAMVTTAKDQCIDVVEKSDESSILLSVDDSNVVDLFNMAHGPLGVGNDWAMFKDGKTLVKDMDYNYKLYVASGIYGNSVTTYNFPNGEYKMQLDEEYVKSAMDLVFGKGNYNKTDSVPYLCGTLFWNDSKKVYYSENLGCGGRLGTASAEVIIKAEKFDDRIEISSAVGYSLVEDTIYKDFDFEEKVSDKINVSGRELEEFVKSNPNKFYNYKYTFKLNDSGFYNYYSIERIN